MVKEKLLKKTTLRLYPSDIHKLSVREAIDKYGVEIVRRYVNRKNYLPKIY